MKFSFFIVCHGNRFCFHENFHPRVNSKFPIRNPFFLVSHGYCGAQLALNENPISRKKRSPVSGRVVMGHETLYHGQIPWQALLWSDIEVTNSKIPKKLNGFCGGTVISPYHILTAAHCIKVQFFESFKI